MNDFDDRISRHLETQAGTIEVFGGDLDAVVTRARHRRHRRRVVSVAALVVVVGAGAAVAVNQRQDKEQPVTVDPGPETGTAENSLQWTTVEPESALGWAQSLSVGPDGTLYALSTAPGIQDPNEPYEPTPQIMYSSGDGVEWAPGAAPAQLWASSLEASGGRLYAVGTGPASAAEGEPYNLQVAASDDGGGTWTNATLPLDVAGLKDRLGPEVSVAPAKLAVRPDGAVLATVSVTAWVDFYTRLPVDVDQRWGYEQTATGVDVFGPPSDWEVAGAGVCPDGWALVEDAPAEAVSPPDSDFPTSPPVPGRVSGTQIDAVSTGGDEQLWCVAPDESEASPMWAGDVHGPVVRSFTWDDLDVDPELQALVGGEVRAFLATDGVHFEEVSVAAPGDGTLGAVEPVATPEGFALVVSRTPDAKPVGPFPLDTATVLTSTDGRSWAPHPAGPLSGWVRSAGTTGDRLAVVLEGDGGLQLATSTAGGPWTLSSPLDALVEAGPSAFVSDVVVGPLGAAATIGVTSDAIADAGGIEVEEDGGYVLRLLDSVGAAQLVDASGAVVAATTSYYDESVSPDFAYVGEGTELVVRDPASGATLATFSGDEINRAIEAVGGDDYAAPTWYVAHSGDGASWSITPLSDLLGEAPSMASVAMTPAHVVVRASFPTPEPNEPERQVALVGTPAG